MRRGLNKTSKQKAKQRGFTLVELLIVIVVIAILAAITIIAYNGVTHKAVETSMQSDLRNAATAIEIDHQTNGVYPPDATSVNDGQGLKSSGDNELTYMIKPYGYCLSATNDQTTTLFRLKSSEGQITNGDCQTHVTTFAGSGAASFADGTGTAAMFNVPEGIAIDSSGTIYVADYSNNRIRKITPAGVVTTFAGSTQGYADGTGAAAQFYRPTNLAVDMSGNIYVADTNNFRIRKITPAGVVTTFAGSTQGYADGTGAAAQFYGLGGITIDSSNTMYVSDGYRIRKITSSGVVTTIAGSTQGYADGTGAAAKFYTPVGITVDAAGNLYVADQSDNRIRKITSSGVVTTIAGAGIFNHGNLDGTGTAALFYYPIGITIDTAGNLYVADSGNNRIRKITPDGVVTTIAGSTIGFADGIGTAAKFNSPYGIAIDGSNNIYVGDSQNNRIRKVEQ